MYWFVSEPFSHERMPSTRLPNASAETPMVVCYVKLGTDDSKAHALLLPDALPPFEWHELDVRPSVGRRSKRQRRVSVQPTP